MFFLLWTLPKNITLGIVNFLRAVVTLQLLLILPGLLCLIAWNESFVHRERPTTQYQQWTIPTEPQSVLPDYLQAEYDSQRLWTSEELMRRAGVAGDFNR